MTILRRMAPVEVPKPIEAEKAYKGLRELIIRLEILPGAVLDERVIREKLGVGRTPFREAINRLAAEELVVILPHRGAFVATIEEGDAQRLYEARLHVERFTARLAAERITPELLDRLENLIAGIGEASRLTGYSEIDWQFHTLIAEASQNRYLASMVERLYTLSCRLKVMRRPDNTSADSIDDYRSVAEALLARDPDRSEAAMVRHISSVLRRNLGLAALI